MQTRRKPGTVSQTTRQAQARRLARIIHLKPKTDNPDTVKGFLNYLGEPKVLAAHTDTTLGGPVSQAAAKYTEKQLLTPASDIPDNATQIRFLGADGVKLWSRAWNEIQSA